MNWVVDASVAVKWFVDEELADEAAELLHGPNFLYAPDLIVSEITNALWKKFTRGHITHQQAEVFAASITHAPVDLVPSQSLHQRALNIAIEIRHSTYDCFYLACAERMGEPLITADARLCTVVRDGTYAGLVRHLSDVPA